MRTVRCGSIEYAPSKIICIGKNFPEHVKEMGSSALPTEPVIFLKPNSAIAFDKGIVSIPESLGFLHHEVELCILADSGGRDLTLKEAQAVIIGYAVGIDFTLRERQAEAKKAGAPWALAKGFDSAAVLGEFVLASSFLSPLSREISLSVNGNVRQRANMGEMIFPPAEIIRFTSQFMTIEPGDIFMCGTPSGVGEIQDKDEIAAAIDGLPLLRFKVIRK